MTTCDGRTCPCKFNCMAHRYRGAYKCPCDKGNPR